MEPLLHHSKLTTMKKTGQIIIIIGVIMTIVAGFELTSRKKVVDIGRIEITAQEKHVFDWSPVLGLSVLAVGAGIFLFAKKNPGKYSFNK
jgi:hypothetical protein